MASLKELQQALAVALTSNNGLPGQHPVQDSRQDSGQDLLVGFDPVELQQSRETLVRKRLSQIASLMPKTQASLQVDYEPWCRAYIDQSHFQGFQAPQLDAIHFVRWLKATRHIAGWRLEVAVWEAMRVEWGISKFLFRIKIFRYDVLRSIADGIEPPARRSVWIAVRLGRWGLFRRW